MTDAWTPRIVVFQCQFALFSATEQEWMDTQLPPHIKLIKVPCSGRISPLFLLNAIQGGVDGILINGCVPGKCHFKEGNLAAHRRLNEFRRLLTFLGMEQDRVRFAWIDVGERGRIRRELADLEATLRELGESRRLVTRVPLAI
jgi:F420-non-reducing hydrogenase iron-sulfur subunit